MLETARAISHKKTQKDIFFADLFFKVISSHNFRACQNNNWGHMEWEQFQVGSDLFFKQINQNNTLTSANFLNITI